MTSTREEHDRSRRTLEWSEPRIEIEDGATRCSFRTRIPDDYAFFDGHFPTYPVLPGAVQLHELVLPCLRRVRPGAGPLSRLTGLKFPTRILPGDTLDVSLRWQDDGTAIAFSITRAGVRCTVGRVHLREETSEGNAG